MISQDRQDPDRSNTGWLSVRIMGRTKEYRISKEVGETERRSARQRSGRHRHIPVVLQG